MPILAMRLALERKVLCMRDDLQMIRVPAGIDAAAVMEFLAFWDRTTEELPAEPVGIAVLCLGDAAVGCGHPDEQPAGAELRMGRPKGREVNQALQLGATSLARLG